MHIQFRNGSPQIFKPEVPEHRILHGTLDALKTGQHRFKLTFTQVPCVLLLLRLFPFSILLKEVCDLLWHRYLLTVVDDDNVVVHLCPFRFRRKGTHPRCRYSAKNCRPSWSILRTGVVIMPYGAHECLRPHRGVDLTGKLRDLALAYYQYKVNLLKCQDTKIIENDKRGMR